MSETEQTISDSLIIIIRVEKKEMNIVLLNWCKVAQQSLRVTRVIDDNTIEKQPTNRLSNQVSELNNTETKSLFYTHENVLDSVECSRKI